MDVHNRETRSFNMSRIKSRDTKPELVVRSLCHRMGLRFRLHRKDLPGKPDLVFPGHRTVLFVHGCYWHSHDCKYGSVQPKTNAEFWKEKRRKTVERDLRNKNELHELQWRVLTYWECQIKKTDEVTQAIAHDFGIKCLKNFTYKE